METTKARGMKAISLELDGRDVSVGDLECGEQYYAVQWRSDKRGLGWLVHRRRCALDEAIRILRDLDVGEAGIEWRIVYVTEMIRVVTWQR